MVGIMLLLLLIKSFVDETETQTFNDYMQDYTNLKTKIGDSIIHLQIKIQVFQNKNVHSQLVPLVGGTGITTITVLLCQMNT